MGQKILIPTLAATLLAAQLPTLAQERILGADISYWNCGGTSSTGISQNNWNTAFSTGNRKFVWLRATRGGTTGVDQIQGTPGGGSTSTLSRRYDDPRFVQNIVRAPSAGMMAGPYHFARPDVTGNTGTDEANHFLEMAGAWMRPGYLMPVFDQEAGSGSDFLAQFAIDFSDRIYSVMQIRPAIYINGNYSSIFQGATLGRRNALAQPSTYTPSVVGPAYPMLWNARYSDNDNPNAIPVQTGSPKTTYTTLSIYYGPWDDYGNPDPWAFWQYASTLSIPGFNAVDTSVDGNVSHGDIEYVRNYLVPAVWWTDASGDWGSLANWNSGQTPVAPILAPGQATPYATGPLPTPRLPGATGSGPTSGQFDTVILERPTANISVTLSSGSYNIRKLYVRENLNITGGSLNINYNPEYRPDNSALVRHGGPLSAQFSGTVTLSGSGSLSAHTLQLDAGRVFLLTGGTLGFNTLNLMPAASVPARLLLNGDSTLSPLANTTATIKSGAGAGNPGFVDLNGGMRTLNVVNGTSDIDVSIDAPINNGGLTKSGAGTLRLNSANTYAGGTVVSAGRLLVNNPSGTGTGPVTVEGGTLLGNGTIAGPLTVDPAGTLAPGVSLGTLTLNASPSFGGTTLMEINRNNGTPISDKIVLTSGTLNYGGTLMVTNTGAAFTGGEVFTLFSAPAYGTQFADFNLPPLGPGLNWHTGALAQNGTLAVNRQPVAGPLLTFTNTAPAVLEIPFATLTANGADPDNDSLTVAAVDLTTTNGVALTTNATSISYANLATANDQFSYTLTDGRGGSTTGLVSIVNIGAPASAEFVGTPTFNGSSLEIQFSATPGWTYYLERSTNLTTWTAISTNTAPANGLVNYTDTFQDLAEPPAAAFYRLYWLP